MSIRKLLSNTDFEYVYFLAKFFISGKQYKFVYIKTPWSNPFYVKGHKKVYSSFRLVHYENLQQYSKHFFIFVDNETKQTV